MTALGRIGRVVDKSWLRLSVAWRMLRDFEDSLPRSRYKLSFSQSGEDLIVWFLLERLGVQRPTYVDIGAHHPELLSNTALFYLLGGHGINIEPDPVLFAAFPRRRRRDVNVNVGIAARPGSMTYYRMSDPALGTFCGAHANRLASEEGIAIEGRIEVPVDTISNVLQRAGLRPDFLTIDAEGKDAEILESYDFTAHRPAVVCAETISFSLKGRGGEKRRHHAVPGRSRIPAVRRYVRQYDFCRRGEVRPARMTAMGRPPITVRLMDGLGNQLFQYALGRSLSAMRGTGLRFDLSWYRPPPARPAQSRAMLLRDFDVRGEFAENVDFSGYWTYSARQGGRLRWRLEQAWLPYRWRRFIEQKPELLLRGRMFEPGVLAARPGTYLSGWWISPHYFRGVEPQLRREIVFRRPLSPRGSAYLDEVRGCESVAVHVRRGDYVNHPHIGCLGASYYERAIRRISDHVASPRYFVFSDDPAAARSLMSRIVGDFQLVELETHESAAADMTVMAGCRHFVIANSTFSWWGAWLSRSPGKIVVAPRHWFAGARVAVEDVYPEGWMSICD